MGKRPGGLDREVMIHMCEEVGVRKSKQTRACISNKVSGARRVACDQIIVFLAALAGELV